MPPIAKLHHRLTIEAPEDEPDGAGGVVRLWSPLGQIWAAIEPLAASDAVVADKRIGALTHRIVLRHRDGRFLECLVSEERP
jgi:SPP1 family predicted phage head-tail adaptor